MVFVSLGPAVIHISTKIISILFCFSLAYLSPTQLNIDIEEVP